MSKYAKAIAAAIAAAATVIVGAVGPDTALGITLSALIAACGVIAVYQVPNKDA